MVDWSQAEAQLACLEIEAATGFYLALFPPKQRTERQGCLHIPVTGSVNRAQVEADLSTRPGYSFGYIPNHGGTKDREIQYCRALFFEDDNPNTGLEEKQQQWELAGLPRPSLQIWTGGKSVHHYWLLETPCSGAEFRFGQRRLFKHVKLTVEGSQIDMNLCNPARIMRLAGGTHPETGEVSRILTSSGEKFSFDRLCALTAPPKQDEAPLPTSTYPTSTGLLSQAARKQLGHTLPITKPSTNPDCLPERDIDASAYAAFLQQQRTYDEKHRPQGLHYSALAHDEKVNTVSDALRYCPQRQEPGSSTYQAAFPIYAALVNEFGTQTAVKIAEAANWSTEYWDLQEQAETIQRNTKERGSTPHKRIYFIFDTAEFNGWSRPWPLEREIRLKHKDEDDSLVKELRQLSFAQWSKSAAHNLTLKAVFHPRIAELLGGRADAFPVAHTAMIAPLMTTMSAVMGRRFRVQIKVGWKEPMVFWMGTVAPASSLKTPVANQFLSPLLHLDARDQRLYKTQLRRYKALPKEDREDPPELPRQRVIMDATLEGLCGLLERESTHGVVSFHDELAAFIGDMDKYRSNSSDRAHWLSMWSGGAVNVLRKGTEPIMIDSTAVSVFGAIQQDKLSDMLHGDDATSKSGDGFWSRFLWVVPEYVFPAQNLSEVEIHDELRSLIDILDESIGKKKVVRLDPQAWHLFAQVCDEWSAEADRTYASRSAFLGKLRGYLARCAGLLHALDYAAEAPDEAMEDDIPLSVMERAVILCRYFLCQFDVLAPQVGGGDLPTWVVKIVSFAKTTDEGIVTHRDLVLKKWANSGEEARQMLESLVRDYGVGKVVATARKNQTHWQLST